MIRVGTAGWDYDDWRGVVYPEHAPKGFDPLSFLARYFDLVELNNTFYRPASETVARSWCARVQHNPRFRFTAKLYRRFTHERGAAWTAGEVREARAGLERLASEGRLGAVLLQFPWSFKNDGPAREWLSDLFAAFKGLPLVLEVRHSSWVSEEDAGAAGPAAGDPRFLETLAEHGVGFVNIDQPLFKRSVRPSALATSRVGYIRVHGRNWRDWFRKDAGRDARYDYLYSADELQPWAARARQLAEGGKAEEIYVVTNNHYQGQAAANATMLDSMLKARRVPAPPDLVRHYPALLAPYAEPASTSGAPAPA